MFYKGLRYGLATLDVIGRLLEYIFVEVVFEYFAGNFQGFQDGHTGRNQRAQGTRGAGRVHFFVDGADDWHAHQYNVREVFYVWLPKGYIYAVADDGERG